MAISNERRLRELLQLPPAADVSTADASRPEYWDEPFMRLGRAYGVELEAGEYPVDHSRLTESLLPLVAPWVEGARYTQVLPGQNDVAGGGWGPLFPEEDGEGRGTDHRYTLRLTHGGGRYGVTFQDSSEDYNLNAVLALLNAALETCGTSLRLFGLGNVVLLGPLGGLQQALREGFIPGFEGEGIHEEWELEAIDAWCESGDTPESLARQLEKGLRRVQVSLVV
jgi:hypothetical protein